jgi:hypothetical protein
VTSAVRRRISLKMLQIPHAVENGRTPPPRGETHPHSTVSALRRNRQPLPPKLPKNCNGGCSAPGRLLIQQSLPKDVLAVPAQILGMRGVVGIHGFEEFAAGMQHALHHLARHLVS